MGRATHWSTSVRWAGLGLLAGVAIAWALGAGRTTEARAQGQAAAPADSGTLAFTTTTVGSTGAGMQHLYVIDTKAQAFAVYRIDPAGAVKLEAARQYRWDLKLAEFNNQEPQVAAIEAMVSGASAAPRR